MACHIRLSGRFAALEQARQLSSQQELIMQSRPFRGRYVMTIAVSSQNRMTVTAHAGKCRRFWLYRVVDTEVRDKRLIELAPSETFHEHHDAGVHPLNGINVLIAGGLGAGLHERLKRQGVMAVATLETDPDKAVSAWLDGSLVEMAPNAQASHMH